MKSFRLSPICLAVLSISVLTLSTAGFAQERSPSQRAYDNAYDDGYEDGYDDAMEDCPCPPLKLKAGGLYFGLGAGYEGFQVPQHPWIDADRIGTFNTHANGWNGRLFGGYGYAFQRYYLALELMLGMSNASGSNFLNSPGTAYRGTVSAGTSCGLSILPGFKLHDSGPLVYGRIGALDTQFTIKDMSGATSTNKNYWEMGVNYGLGVELPLAKSFSTRIEYDYIKYPTITNNGQVGSSSAPSDNKATLDFLFRY